MDRPVRLRVVALILLIGLVALGGWMWLREDSRPEIAVSGAQLVDGEGRPVLLRGVNRVGSEYACIDGYGIFDGPTDDDSVEAMRTWNVNAVRVHLNSACWLDLEDQFITYDPEYAGRAYRDAIGDFVARLGAHGMYVILDLQWSGCGAQASCRADSLKPMPEAVEGPAFWSSVAEQCRDDHWVLFDVFNEAQGVSWSCWRDGGCQVTAGTTTYRAAGMQQLVDAVRGAGATTQPILVGELASATDTSGFLSHQPDDASDALVVSVHLFDDSWPCPGSSKGSGSAAGAIACLSGDAENSLDPVAAVLPVVFAELGQSRCATDFVAPVLDWIDQRRFGALGWAWNAAHCSSFPALIRDYTGTPTTFGRAFRDAYLAPPPTAAAPARRS